MKENIKEISEVPRPSSAPEIEFETEANLVTVTFFLRIFTGLRIGCFVRRQRLGGMWFSSVCVVFGFVSGFPFFVVSGKEKLVVGSFSIRVFIRKGERKKNGSVVPETLAYRR